MLEYVLVAIGGAFGSTARFATGRFITNKLKWVLPTATFFINISGSFLLGVIIGIGIEGNLLTFFGVGFLGAYTTYSTYMYEAFTIFIKKQRLWAVVYVLGSLLSGILSFMAGFMMMGL